MSRAVEQAHRALAGREEPFDYRTRADGTVGCRECGDSQWVTVPSEGALVVRPCHCNERLYDRWARGFPKLDGHRHSEDEFIPRDADKRLPEQEMF